MCRCSSAAESKIAAQGGGAKLLMECNFQVFNPQLLTSVPEVNMHVWVFYESFRKNLPHRGLLSVLLWPQTLYPHLGQC